MIVALILIAVAVGSVVFHLVTPWWWTEIASNWGFIDTTTSITFWVTGVAYTAIIVFIGYCVWRYRHREGHTAQYEPENKTLEWWLTVGTTVGVVVMLAPGLLAWQQFVSPPEEATDVEVVGQQWLWNYRLPGEDGVLGKADTRNISYENPLGLNKDDPHAQDDILIQGGALHLPVDKPVKMVLRAKDVIHNFYVPQFRAKMDMVPGQVSYFWLTPTRTGEFEVLCAELCGSGHHSMRGTVVVQEQDDYEAWLEEQQTFAETQAAAAGGGGDVDVAARAD